MINTLRDYTVHIKQHFSFNRLDASILKHQLQSYGMQVRKEAAKPAVEASKDDSRKVIQEYIL